MCTIPHGGKAEICSLDSTSQRKRALYVLAQILTPMSVQTKRAVPTSTAYSAALQHVLFCVTANKQHGGGNLGLRVWCQKVPNCSVSL